MAVPAADRWREDYRIAGADGLELHQFYRAMAWLGEALPNGEQDGATPFAPRCVKDLHRKSSSWLLRFAASIDRKNLQAAN
jgi:hypothetical protein